jgi:hypothetical protein
MIIDVAVITADISGYRMIQYPVADFEILAPQYIFTEFCLNFASPLSSLLFPRFSNLFCLRGCLHSREVDSLLCKLPTRLLLIYRM